MPPIRYPAPATSVEQVRARKKTRGLSTADHLLYRSFLAPSGCWEWAVARQPNGYGRVTTGGRAQLVHRVAYREFVGPIPDGMVVDHLCSNRACINPAHLRVCSQQENLTAPHSLSPPALNARQTHCKRGHEFTPENTYTSPAGKRTCRECAAMHEAERWADPVRKARILERDRARKRAR